MADLIAAQFVVAPNGTYDFGVIDPETAVAMGAQPGPIRLQHGYPGPKGFGLRHVEAYAPRMRQLAEIGFGTFGAFAFEVAQNYTIVLRGDPTHRFQIVHRRMCGPRRFDLKLVIEPMRMSGAVVYTTVTGIFAPIARGELICEVTRKGGSVSTPDVAEKRPRFETLSLPKRSAASSGNGS